jgi:cell division protein ZipA
VSPLQWALLLLGVGIIAGLVWSSRREKKALEKLNAPAPRPVSRDWSVKNDALPESPPRAPAAAPAAAHSGVSFDEFGVGKPRKAGSTIPPTARVAPIAAPAGSAASELVIGFYIAEYEGTNILGPRIHAALRDRGLRFGARRIYHRYDGEQTVFSVASLVKPGALDPVEAEGFATPGLSVFLQLPGPARPLAAFQEMLDTARGLARALNAELYDTEQRAPLSAERERALHEQVEDWAKRHVGRA